MIDIGRDPKLIEFVCEKCDHTFCVSFDINSPKYPRCTNCGSEKTEIKDRKG